MHQGDNYKSFRIQWFPFLLVLFLALSVVSGSNATGSPNVVLILADDLGYGDLSSYGAPDLKTPHIDSIIQEGRRYGNFYANSPVCSPTRAALLTGRYPDLVGVPGVIRTYRHDNWGHLSPEATLLPELLQKAGYRTACIGKWHLGLDDASHPNSRGFDFFHGFLGDMMDDYFNHLRHGNNYVRLNRDEIDPVGHATDLFTQWAVDYLEAVDSETPFFLYLAYNAPHTPIQPPEDWVARVREREPHLDGSRAALVALIEHMDDGVGQILRKLENRGLMENTLILFTSDNGGQLNVGASNGSLRGGKQNMWEGGIRVPFAARWTGKIPAGTVSDRVGITMDLFPTICDAAGVSVPDRIDGVSLLPDMVGDSAGPSEGDRDLIWVRREGNSRYGGRSYYAARRGAFKLLQNTPFEPMQLFNLETDPIESNPLPNDHPSYSELFQLIMRHITEAGMVPWQRGP
ncbi:MAG: sulfatase-like hydrolase/transferase [Acidobacteriota bacterium]|nr:MAG: sulfatase-like hydrolase/transferase [Acidobacteriota bacterium]